MRDVVGVDDRQRLASVNPSAPIIATYIQEIVRMLALPSGAALAEGPVAGVVQNCVPAGNLQVRRDRDRTDAGTAATVRNAEGLVQIQMADVGAEITGPAQSDLSIHVGAIHVNLASELMNDPADLDHALLEHAMGRRIGDHQGAETIGVRFGLGANVVDIDVAVVVTTRSPSPRSRPSPRSPDWCHGPNVGIRHRVRCVSPCSR